jgi:heme-degrading monooxygenase HmoA
MFVAIYRWRLKPDREGEVRGAWSRVTQAIHTKCGSHGSSLFRADDGGHVGIACWPSRDAWQQCRAAEPSDLEIMERCIAERFPPQLLESEAVRWDLPPSP